MDKKEYKPLIIPALSWNKKTLSETYGELIAQPLETGFGITLANALRRTLLASVEGAAITSAVIKGVNNEFSVLPGIVEDTMQVALNLKEVVVKNKTGLPGKMKLEVKGEAVAKVSDIVADDHLELINKDHIIAHVAPEGTLDIEFFVESGRGYQQAQWPEGQSLQQDGRIYLDSLFSPIRKINFKVEKTRVGKEIDYDKLLLQIYTDGSENPVDVVHYATSVLRTQLEHFLTSSEIPFNQISKAPEQSEEEKPVEPEALTVRGISVDLLLKPIDELELSVRAHNCLVNANIKRVIDLVNLIEDDTLKIKNFGRKSLNEVKDSMKAFGLTLGMDISEEELQKVLSSKQ